MKKRWIVTVFAAALAVSQPLCVYGANSITTEAVIGSNSPISSTGSKDDVVVIASGENTVNESGGVEKVVRNERGQAVIGNTAVEFVKEAGAATAGLPEPVVESISAINQGKPLSEAVKDVNVEGYNALTGTHAIVTRAADTNAVKTGDVRVPIYVPNLTDGLGTVEVLFYNNATGRWELIAPSQLDIGNKTLWVNLAGSGTFTVVYKR